MEKELTNSEKIHKQLSKLSYTIYENYFSHVRDELDYINANIQLSESKEAVLFSTLFIELFELSIIEEYYWRYCDFKTYRNKYKERLNEFIKQYGPDVSEIDFIDAEKETIEKGFLSYSFPIDDYPFDSAAIEINFLDKKIQKRLTYSKNKKLNFLESELKRIEKQPEFYSDYFENILPPNYIRDIKNRNEILAGFITSAGSDKKLELLPYNDFLKKYNQLTERGQIAFLSELKRIISNGAISKAYLLKEWKDINLKSFVNSQLDSISRINDLEVEIQIDEKSETKKTISENDFPEIFKNDGCQVFWLLNEKYQNSNKKLKAKYSNLYHYLKYEDLLRCTQLEYIEFIKEQFGVEMSKILPKTLKYEDDIQSLLMKYHKGQQ